MSRPITPKEVRCPICGASAGKPCRSVDMRFPSREFPYFHKGRIDVYWKAVYLNG